MKLSSEYQETEVGVFPPDWKIAPLSCEIELLEAGVSVNSVDQEAEASHENAVLKTSSVSGGRFIASESKRIATRDLHRAVLSPRADSIIISRMNTPELVGECGYVASDLPDLFLPDRLWMTRHRRAHGTSVRWLSYVLSSDLYKSRIKAMATGTSGSMKNIAKDALLAIPIAFPPPKEQRAIAAALSDVDTLVDSLTRLIAKKRDLKHAAMQQLLTGRTRLPGFRGEWASVRLGELGDTYGGLTGKSSADFGAGGARYIPFMDVIRSVSVRSGSTFERVRVGSGEAQNAVKRGDLLLNGSSETPEEVAMCAVCDVDDQDLFLNSFCFGFRLRPSAEADALFLAYLLRSDAGRAAMRSLAQGSTRHNIAKSAFLDACLLLPSKSEQAEIATVLSDMDAELAALEARHAKTQALKQAMMQALLTGRIRLVTPEPAHA